MTLSAWRPLKDAPKSLPAYVEDSNGTHVATWDDEWGYWLGEELRILSEDTLSLPIADTLELDRAVQGEIARAFGALFQAMVDAEHYLSIRGPNSSYDLIYEDAANTYRAAGLRTFAHILHTSMGGRIPDEVP